ncbi:hypothetical protein Bbelb_334750, partial [Branchiostoma belcheri]
LRESGSAAPPSTRRVTACQTWRLTMSTPSVCRHRTSALPATLQRSDRWSPRNRS